MTELGDAQPNFEQPSKQVPVVNQSPFQYVTAYAPVTKIGAGYNKSDYMNCINQISDTSFYSFCAYKFDGELYHMIRLRQPIESQRDIQYLTQLLIERVFENIDRDQILGQISYDVGRIKNIKHTNQLFEDHQKKKVTVVSETQKFYEQYKRKNGIITTSDTATCDQTAITQHTNSFQTTHHHIFKLVGDFSNGQAFMQQIIKTYTNQISIVSLIHSQAYLIGKDCYLLVYFRAASDVKQIDTFKDNVIKVIRGKTAALLLERQIKMFNSQIDFGKLKSMCATSDRLTVLSESAELLDLVAKEVQEEEQLNELESQQPRNDNDNTTDQQRCNTIVFMISQPLSMAQGKQLEEFLKLSEDIIVGIRLYMDETNTYQCVCVDTDPMRPGLNRQYFFRQHRKGYTMLQKFGTIVTHKLANDKEFFEQYNPSSTFMGDPDPLTSFKAMQQGILMFEESFKASSLSDKLFTQFHALLEKGEYVTLLTFLERYRHDSKSYKTILKEKSLYQDSYSNYKNSSLAKLKSIPPITTLKEFVDNNPLLEGEEKLTEEMLKELKLYKAVIALFKIVVIRRHMKKGAVCLVGAPNTGKTELLNRMAQIFITQQYRQTNSNFDMSNIDSQYNPQLLTCDEMDVSDLLSNKNVNKTKQLFSREGKIQEVKYSNPTVMFRGASILITCNSFFIDKLNQYDKLAILQRIELCEMEGTVHKLEDKFPFNTRQLAMFMYDKYLEDLAEDIESSSSEYESDSQDSQVSFKLPQPILGKRKRSRQSSLNSSENVKQTQREIEWGKQSVLDTVLEKKKSDEAVQAQ